MSPIADLKIWKESLTAYIRISKAPPTEDVRMKEEYSSAFIRLSLLV